MDAHQVKPYAYLVRKAGYGDYSEILRSRRQAEEAARDMRWWSGRVTITPLFAGKPEKVK